MGTSEGKLLALTAFGQRDAPKARVSVSGSKVTLPTRSESREISKARTKRAPSLNLSPSRAELFDFRYLLGRSSARIALFEIEPLVANKAKDASALAAQFWRSESRFIDGNETFYSAYGCKSVEECVGKSFGHFFPRTQLHEELIRQWCEGGLVLGHFDLMTENLDGSHSFFSAAMYAVDERSLVTRFWVVLRDVTPLADALSAVSEQEQHYRTLVETSGFFMIRSNAEGRITYVSPSLSELTGYPVEEFRSSPHLYRSIIHPDDIDQVDNKFQGSCILDAKTTPKTNETEYRILCKDGTYRWMFERQTISTAAIDATQHVGETNCDSLIFDIQDRKLLESGLRHSQRIDMVGQLAGGIAHDFNNYLTAILGQLRLSLIEVPSGSGTHERLLATEQAALRCAEMTRQLLSLAHRDEVVKKQLSVANLVTSTASLCSHLLPPSICLKIEEDGHGCFVEGDAGQLQQVLINLIVNARDAISGAGLISITVGDRTISPDESVLALAVGPYIELTITDNGSGISSGHINHIFEPFFTTKSSGQGTGLGLSLVYSIIRNHGGSISVSSEKGVGTSFRLLLPAIQRVEKESLQQLASDIQEISTKDQGSEGVSNDLEEIESPSVNEVLVVDDEPLVRSVIKASLLGSGFLVTEACDGMTALKLLSEEPNRYGLVVIDQTMPGLSGKEVVAEIRRRGSRVPLLLTTGLHSFDGVPDEDESLHEVLVKPFDPIDLIGAAFRLCQLREK